MYWCLGIDQGLNKYKYQYFTLVDRKPAPKFGAWFYRQEDVNVKYDLIIATSYTNSLDEFLEFYKENVKL